MIQGIGRPKKGYHLQDGTKVPSVTTIISRFKDSGGLIHWAWKEGTEGRDYREPKDAAASAGSAAHAAVDAHIHGRPWDWNAVPDETVRTKAMTAYSAFLEWQSQTKLEVTHTEMPLVSERHGFGGTFDAITVGETKRRAMGDWKSSGAIYPEYLIHLAAYGHLWQENFPAEPLEGGYHLLRFDKEYGDFTHKWWASLYTALEAFLHLRALYELEKELKQRTK